MKGEYLMKKRKQMDERELLVELKISRICFFYQTALLTFLFFILIFGGKINVIDALFFIVATSNIMFLFLKNIVKW